MRGICSSLYQANACYENKISFGELPWLVPAIAKRLVEIAKKEGATAICHGATGKGNDHDYVLSLGH